MKIKLLFLLLIFNTYQTVYAQSSPAGRNQAQQEKIDEARLVVTYMVRRTVDTTTLQIFEDMRWLQIGNYLTRDYSVYSDKSDSIAFEVYKKDASAGANLYDWLEPGHRGYCEDYYLDYPQKGILLNSFFIVNTEYRYTEPIPTFKWDTSHTETQILQGYLCHKATTKFRGRIWIVWYSTEIPFSVGPWKFNGLPGLILSAMDSNQYFQFNVIGIEEGRSMPIYIHDKGSKNATRYNQDAMKIIYTDRDKVTSLQSLFWKDPVYLRELHGVMSAVRDENTQKTIIQKRGEVRLPYIPPYEL